MGRMPRRNGTSRTGVPLRTLERRRVTSDQLMRASRRFKARAKTSPTRPPRVTLFGVAPLLVSACHATPHIREGRAKEAEVTTGALALALARELHASAIVPACVQTDDPNFGAPGPYKATLEQLVGRLRPLLVVDIHGMRDDWGPDICIGVGKGHVPPPSRRFVGSLLGRGLTIGINYPFESSRPSTVSQFVRELGCVALQLELALRCRTPPKIEDAFAALGDSLAHAVGVSPA